MPFITSLSARSRLLRRALRLVRGKLEDGQLSNSPITLRDIDDICAAFSGVLRGVFHERIEYPEVQHRVPVAPVSAEAPAGGEAGSAPAASGAGKPLPVSEEAKPENAVNGAEPEGAQAQEVP